MQQVKPKETKYPKIYYNNCIAFIQTEEGRTVYSGDTTVMNKPLVDYLGNSRVNFYVNQNRQQLKPIQLDDYYTSRKTVCQ